LKNFQKDFSNDNLSTRLAYELQEAGDAEELGGIALRPQVFVGEQPRTLRDGTIVLRGDYIIELHNAEPVQLEDESFADFSKRIKNNFQKTLEILAQMIATIKSADKVKAIYGISYFANRKASEDLGFETEEIADPELRLERTRTAYSMVLRNRFGGDMKKWEEYLQAYPKYTPPVWAFMSKGKLMEKYYNPAKEKI
jgi:uncharacterized protein YeaO (DUF488 family)